MSAAELRQAAEALRDSPSRIEDPSIGLVVAEWLAEVAERVDPQERWNRRSHGWSGVSHARKAARLINGGAA